MSIVKAHHHGFTVADLDRSIAFYRDLLGLEVVRVSERSNLPAYDRILGYPNVKLRIAILSHPVNEFILELVQYVNPRGQTRETENRWVGASHIACTITPSGPYSLPPGPASRRSATSRCTITIAPVIVGQSVASVAISGEAML